MGPGTANTGLVLTSNGYRLDERPERLGRLSPLPTPESGSRRALLDRIGRDGYAFMPGFLDADRVQEFRRYYFEALAPAGLTEASGSASDLDPSMLRQILFDEIVPGSAYDRLCRTPAILDWFGWLLGGEVHLHRRKIIRHVRPGETGLGTATQAHYDLLYLRQGCHQVLSMWIPLGDCPVERGGLVYLEGSHRWVLAEEEAAEGSALPRRPAASITADLPALAEAHDARWLTADYAAGDVVVHCAQIVHAALDNVGDVVRLSTDIRYQRADQQIDRRWQHDWRDTDGL